MLKQTEPPKTYKEFTARFPKIAEAWQLTREQAAEGPLDAKTARLIKLGIAIGAMREGAVHSGVRKSIAMGVTEEEFHQIIALASGVLGFPSTVAIFSWFRDVLEPQEA